MSKHVGEKCGKRADGDRTDGRRPGRTSPYHNTSCLKTGVYKWKAVYHSWVIYLVSLRGSVINLIGRWHSANYSTIMPSFSFLFLNLLLQTAAMFCLSNLYLKQDRNRGFPRTKRRRYQWATKTDVGRVKKMIWLQLPSAEGKFLKIEQLKPGYPLDRHHSS